MILVFQIAFGILVASLPLGLATLWLQTLGDPEAEFSGLTYAAFVALVFVLCGYGATYFVLVTPRA